MQFSVNVRRSIECDVVVEADSAEHAAELVGKADFPLPDQSEWIGIKDWWLRVYDERDELVHEEGG